MRDKRTTSHGIDVDFGITKTAAQKDGNTLFMMFLEAFPLVPAFIFLMGVAAHRPSVAPYLVPLIGLDIAGLVLLLPILGNTENRKAMFAHVWQMASPWVWSLYALTGAAVAARMPVWFSAALLIAVAVAQLVSRQSAQARANTEGSIVFYVACAVAMLVVLNGPWPVFIDMAFDGWPHRAQSAWSMAAVIRFVLYAALSLPLMVFTLMAGTLAEIQKHRGDVKKAMTEWLNAHNITPTPQAQREAIEERRDEVEAAVDRDMAKLGYAPGFWSRFEKLANPLHTGYYLIAFLFTALLGGVAYLGVIAVKWPAMFLIVKYGLKKTPAAAVDPYADRRQGMTIRDRDESREQGMTIRKD
ncbi:hypothetical protein [Burkholderia ubonensis]|uniref:Uncharacterized protein n=1 Tax=Burkholderia ubonensis TaxID=101571 RepID=A0A1R1J7X2_9BURK|nr:hypothetical protein [Burkholderia ubonensis]OMG71394.1 hypothetical protein BW685_21370 [Burkholderia ubonensis]